MTLEEAMKKEDAIIKKMIEVYNPDNYIALRNVVDDFCDRAARNFSSAVEISGRMLAQMSSLGDSYVNNIIYALQNIDWDVITEAGHRMEKILQSPAISDFVERLDSYVEFCESAVVETEEETIEIFTTAIDVSLPLLPDTKQSDIQDAAQTVIAPGKRRKLTLNDIITLINVLLAIYTAIVSSLPNEQLDRLAAQNEVIIGQNETIIKQNKTIIDYLDEQSELAQKDAEVVAALSTLTESIDALIDKADELRVQGDDVDNSEEVSEKQSDQ